VPHAAGRRIPDDVAVVGRGLEPEAGTHQIDGAQSRVGILARHQHDVAMVERAHGLVRSRREPREE